LTIWGGIVMKYLYGLGFSAIIFLGMIGPSINIRIGQKLLYGKEDTKEEIKKDYRVSIVLWAILTIALYIFLIFFTD